MKWCIHHCRGLATVDGQDADEGYTGRPKEREQLSCVKSQTYQGPVTEYE